MDAAMSAAGRSRPGSRRTSMLGGATPSMRPVGRDTPRSRLHNQLNTPGMFDSAPVIPDFDLVGPQSWDAESTATTRAGSTRPPPHPHMTPRHAMQPSVEDAPPSGLTSARHSPLHSGAIIESKRNSGMETVHEEPVAGPSTFPPVALSVDPPQGPSPSQRAGSSGRSRDDHQLGSGWGDFDAHAPPTSGWDDFGGGGGGGGDGDGWPGGFSVGGGGGWPDEPPPLASGLGLSGATASQQGSRRPSDASLYVQDPIQPQTPARSRAHSRAPSGSGLSNMARSPPGGTAASLAPPHVRSPTLSDAHGANLFHAPVATSPSPPRPQPIRTNVTPTRSNPTPGSRSVRPTPIARDYALPEGQRTIPLAPDGTPRFPQHGMPVPAGVSTPNRALREAMFMGNGTPRHPAAARQAHPSPPQPEPEPEPPQEQPQEEPAAPGKKGFLSRMSSMLNRDRNIQKDKPPAPRKVKKKKGKGAVEEMLAEELGPEAGPSALGDVPALAEHDPAEEERKRAEEEEARKKAEEEDEKRRKEEAEKALLAAEEEARLASERRRQEDEERRLRDEEEEQLARERAEAVEAEHAQVLSQHGDVPLPDPPAAAVDDQADKGEGGGGGWGIFRRRNTKKKKGAQKAPTPPPPEPSPFTVPPLPTDAPPADVPPPAASVPPSPPRSFAPAPPNPPLAFAAPPSPIRTYPYQQSPRPTLDTTVHGHAPTLIQFSGGPDDEHRPYVYMPSNATPTPGQHRTASTTHHAVAAPAPRRSPTHVYAGTAAAPTPRLPSTYTMPFPHSHGPGRSPLPRVASGASGAMAFRVPSRAATATAPATPSVPSAQLLAEHAKVLGTLEGAEAARERAFLQNEERRARLFDEAEDRRRQEAEARRRVIEVWV